MINQSPIAAIATAPGRAGIGILRVSGPALGDLAAAVTGRKLAPREAVLTSFLDARGAPIDEGIALFFPAPHSYTGEDVLELQGHGGSIVLRLLLQRCVELGARIAEPGEFTRRAFLNGKLDLAQAEAVVDLIDASTAQAARSALRSVKGDFSAKLQELTSIIIDLRVFVEASLDFPEEDIEVAEHARVRERLSEVNAILGEVLKGARQGSILRDGLHLALAGRPNVGKSSLLNRLVGEELAIVTDIPGTTRDPVREAIDIEGVPVHVVDTAGLRESNNAVERIGIERAWHEIESADAVLWLVDATVGVTDDDVAMLGRLPQHLPRLRVVNKIDLIDSEPRTEEQGGETSIWLSAKSGAGLHLLRSALCKLAGWQGQSETAFLARERHLVALRSAAGHLERGAVEAHSLELLAEELRLAQEDLGAVTGEFTADDLLGEIFSRFCIGK